MCTPQDLQTFGGRDTWDNESVWNYEAGFKSRVLNGNGAFNVSAFSADIDDLQATVTAGSCSSRVVFNVPSARSQGGGGRVRAGAEPAHRLRRVRVVQRRRAAVHPTSTDASGAVAVVSGIQKGRRLPTVPQVQLAAAATYQWEVTSGSLAYVTGTYPHRLALHAGRRRGAGRPGPPVVRTQHHRRPAHGRPSPTIPSCRPTTSSTCASASGARPGTSGSSSTTSPTSALSSLDRERGTRARIGFLTNQPCTFGITTRFDF